MMWTYIFGSICPAKGKSACLVMPWCEIQSMTEHLKEISATVDPGIHAVLMLDQVGWHGWPLIQNEPVESRWS